MIDENTSSDRLDRLTNGLHRVGRIGAWLCGAALLGVSVLVVLEIAARNFLGSRVHGAEEIAGYVFAILVAWGFGYSLLERSHIRLDFIYARLSPPVRRLCDVTSLVSMLALSAFLAWRAWLTFAESWAFDSTSTTSLHTPLWIPQFLWVVGMGFFALTSLVVTAVAIRLIALRRHRDLHDVAGIPSNQG